MRLQGQGTAVGHTADAAAAARPRKLVAGEGLVGGRRREHVLFLLLGVSPVPDLDNLGRIAPSRRRPILDRVFCAASSYSDGCARAPFTLMIMPQWSSLALRRALLLAV